MKKKFFVFITVILSFFCFLNINANAYFFAYDTPECDQQAKTITQDITFFVIGCPNYAGHDYTKLRQTYFRKIIQALNRGSIWYESTITDGTKQCKIKNLFFVNESNLFCNRVYLNNQIIMEVIDPLNEVKVLVREDINLLTFIGPSISGYHLEKDFSFEMSEDASLDRTIFTSEEDEKLSFNNVYGKKYYDNIVYEQDDVHFVVDYRNPLSIEQLLTAIHVDDMTEGDITDCFSTTNNTYILTNGKIPVGQYGFLGVVTDSSGNCSSQYFYVDVIDVVKPVITGPDLFEQSYDVPLSNKDILNMFQVSDEFGIKSLTIIKDEYSSSARKPGKYNLTIQAIDNNDNIATHDFQIEVVDKTPPVIIFDVDFIQVYTPLLLTEEQIKKHIYVFDAIDGEITTYELNDDDGYFTYGKQPGDFYLSVMAKDSTGNEIYAEIHIISSDCDYPYINANKYCICVSKGGKISMDEAKALLENILAMDLSNASIDSCYFNGDTTNSEYPLYITLSDGTVIETAIKVTGTVDESDYGNITKSDSDSINYPLYITLGSIILTISVLGIIIFKKRH